MGDAVTQSALRRVTNLMDFLAEVTDAARRDPVRDILSDASDAPDPIIWLDELPEAVKIRQDPRDGVLVTVAPPRTTPEPALPDELADWVLPTGPRHFSGPEPRLVSGSAGDNRSGEGVPPKAVVAAFDSWLAAWRRWAEAEQRSAARRTLYEQLERAAKAIEQRDDEYEFVLATAFVCWQAPDGEKLRRHLITEQVVPTLDPDSAVVKVSLARTKRHFEDRELFEEQEAYRPERGRALRQEIIERTGSLLDDHLLDEVHNWLGLALDAPVQKLARRPVAGDQLPTSPTMSASPALMLRPRSKAALADTYRRIAQELRQPDATVPVALAQLVMDTDAEQRRRWLAEQGAVHGDLLGDDPLFPLPANEEQKRVLELLRRELGVVVQGPPGTGKTHTIANLVSALLARGLRVLVTSQKEQALRVLREKIPADLRSLCVLLAGGSRDSAKELERSLKSLSDEVARADTASIRSRLVQLEAERHELRSRSALLNEQIGRLRDAENTIHPAVVPGYRADLYRGTLTEIVREVKSAAPTSDWIPAVDPSLPDVPPLSLPDLLDLLELSRIAPQMPEGRVQQYVPAPEELPTAAELEKILDSEQRARATADEDTGELARQLAQLPSESLSALVSLRDDAIKALLAARLYPLDKMRAPDWVVRAARDRLAGDHVALWNHVRAIDGEAARLASALEAQGVRYTVDVPPLEALGPGRARGLLAAGRVFRDYLENGGKVRRRLPAAKAQRAAAPLLDVVRVNGAPPSTVEHLDAALERIEAEVSAAELVAKWLDVGVSVSTSRLTATLSELADNDRLLGAVEEVRSWHSRFVSVLEGRVWVVDHRSLDGFVAVLDALPSAQRHVDLALARTQVERLLERVRDLASTPGACPELALLAESVGRRDLDGYRTGLEAVDAARFQRDSLLRLGRLSRTLRSVHPALTDLITRTVTDRAWEQRLADLPAAWAWSKAQQYVTRQRTAEHERRLVAEFDELDVRINRLTGRIAAARALTACLERMSDTHVQALRSYAKYMRDIGAGTGSKVPELRVAARAAMEKARDAVPAWVVPLPMLLENIAAHRNAFDVVIVDEASQSGMEQLFLLWMAPRVIVVGDDKQCTPGDARLGRLDPLFDRLDEYLGDIGPELRMNFTSKTDLYGLLSSRSGKDAVVRLREHFRSMPEIIGWSSSQFYGEQGLPGLIPLRERKAEDLEPLKVVRVAGAYTDGSDSKRRNPVEAKRIVQGLLECIADRRYAGKTFGVVVLQGYGQVKLLDHEIAAAISPEERSKRKIRVGTAAEFQGDERDVIMLSMVVAEPPRGLYATLAMQSFNVAASRARDQMWLFTSVELDQLKPDDLRASLLGYMLNPPSIYGDSPRLEDVSTTKPTEPFESLFEQAVFREIKARGYHVVPQHPVGSRSLDLVVVGAGGRLAVECDGHHWHTSPEQGMSDARRDRELRRMGWDVHRVRESEFEFDPERELASLWQRLDARGIHPTDPGTATVSSWKPVVLHQEGADR